MSLAEPGLQRLRMSWEEYLALPDGVRAEWVDGEVIVSPRPSVHHASAMMRLGMALQLSLPAVEVLPEGGLRLPGNRLRGPDLMVVEGSLDTTFVERVPILVVEILSPSTRSEDLLRKGPEYAAAGVGQFWVVDPAHRTIEVFENVDGTWEPLLRLDDQHPTGEVAVGDHGVVAVDLNQVIRT